MGGPCTARLFTGVFWNALDYELEAIPAIAVTAYASVADRAAALESGYQAHVAKPFDPRSSRGQSPACIVNISPRRE